MSLVSLREEARVLSQALYQQCLSKNKNHFLLKKGFLNAGMWQGAWIRAQKNGTTAEEATLFASFLPLLFPAEGKNTNPWPWQSRSTVLPRDTLKKWIQQLLNLDSQSTIFVDLIPDLGVWVCDVFNYIPRDVWSLAALLIARLYRSSKQLFHHLYPQLEANTESESIRAQFFFAKIDASLNEIFPLENRAKKKGTVREVFCSIADADERYGKHSHVHRHSLYLLVHVALLDQQWQEKIFDSEKNTFLPHFSKISNEFCLSVWYTGLLEVIYFEGHQSTLDWSFLHTLELKVPAELPVRTCTNASSKWREVCVDLIRNKVLKIRALKSNSQLVSRFHDIQKAQHRDAMSAEQADFFDAIEHWVASKDTVAEWGEFQYDYLVMWLKNFVLLNHPSMLTERVQYLKGLSQGEQRGHLVSCYEIFLGESEYALLTCGERKRIFFDLWFLLSLPHMFQGGFSTVRLESLFSLIFDSIPELNDSLLNDVKKVYLPKELGKEDYTKKVLLLGILAHAQDIKTHGNELGQLFRDEELERFVVCKKNAKDKSIATIFSNKEQHWETSPIAIWILKSFNEYRSPLIFQMIQSFWMDCRSEAQKYHLFWQLSLSGTYSQILLNFEHFQKNILFPFHLLDENPVAYTEVDWYAQCSRVVDYYGVWKEIHKEAPSAHRKKENEPPKIIDQYEEVLLAYEEVWGDFVMQNASAFELKNSPAWNPNLWKDMVKIWKRWKNAQQPASYEAFQNWEKDLERFFINIQLFLGTIIHKSPVQDNGKVDTFASIFRRICTDLKQGIETDFDSMLMELKNTDPHHLSRTLPFEVQLIYSDVVSKLRDTMREMIRTEKKYLEWDRDIQSPSISFERLHLFFQDESYWEHTSRVFKATEVEKIIARSWTDSMLTSEDTEVFEVQLSSFSSIFKNYPESRSKVDIWYILAITIGEDRAKIGTKFYPLSLAVHKQIVQVDTSQASDKKEESCRALSNAKEQMQGKKQAFDQMLRRQKLFWLARIFAQGKERIDIGERIIRGTLNHCLNPFVAAIVALTFLLDFGDSLLHLYDYNHTAAVATIFFSVGFAFLHPFFIKHKELGVPFWRSVLNNFPSFVCSMVFSGILTSIWSLAKEGPTFGMKSFLLMLFFTTIIKAATEGAFRTISDEGG